jgi:AraC-like DNA-binding protein
MARESTYRAARLSELLDLSRRQLQRLTLKLFGHSPQAWLDQQRMIAAPSVLKQTRSAKETAFDLGFKQRSHFSLHFKKRYGLWPAEFLANPDRLPPDVHRSKSEQQIAACGNGQGDC